MAKSLRFLLLMLIPLLTVQAAPTAQVDTIDSPAGLLPVDTLVYAEVQFSEEKADQLSTTLLPFALPDLGLFADLRPAWAGDQMGIALLPINDSVLPGIAVLLTVTDEAVADQWVQAITGNRVRLDDQNTAIWLPDEWEVGVFMRTPGYLIVTDRAGTSTRLTDVIVNNAASLADEFFYARATQALSPDPVLRLYEGFSNSNMAAYIAPNQLAIERIRHEDYNPLGVPAPLDASALEGVPRGALLVDAGMNPALAVQSSLNRLDEMFFLPNLDRLSEDFIGVPFYSDLLPLFNGSYAVYVGYGHGTLYEAFGLPLEGGVVLAPENPLLAGLTAININNFLQQEYDLTINTLSPTQFSLEFPDNFLPPVVYGLAQNRLYVSNASGAENIIQALAGPNLTSDPRWQQVMEAAPVGTQRIQYLSLSGFTALVQRFILTAFPDLNIPLVKDIFDYLERYTTIAIYHRIDQEGIALTKWAILLDN